ncbi:MAG: type II toxin-antitoxin system VapC family toxin [Microbacterium sp.]|uniref:type II toxin-antitoxin system VapC family toxin n=1 Tax=Microbacterium sp. TaxID=51671 RepID=UPI0039E294F2
MTIVVDASAMAELLVGSAIGMSVVDALAEDSEWAVPEHFRLEVVSALRGRMLGGWLDEESFRDHLDQVARAELDVVPTGPLLPRIGELAPNATPYDAAYLALAEQLDAAVVTTDSKLASIPGIRCDVRTLTAGPVSGGGVR